MSKQIIEILDRKVIPWARKWGMRRFVIADDTLGGAPLPEGVRVVQTELAGPRIPVKGPRLFGNLSGGIARWPKDSLTEMRAPLIECVVSGEAAYQVGDKIVHGGEGIFILVPPGAPSSPVPLSKMEPPGAGKASTKHDYDLLCFSAFDNDMQCRLCYRATPHFFVPNPSVVQLLALVMEEGLAHRMDQEDIGGSLLLAFLAMLRRDLASGNSIGQAMEPVRPLTLEERLEPIARVERYIKSHLALPHTIEAAASMALMSRAQFTKKFRQATGQTFVEYLTACRLEEAKMLLRETDWSISTIHHFVGFNDATRLRKIFSDEVGMTLSQYRNAARLEAEVPGRSRQADKHRK